MTNLSDLLPAGAASKQLSFTASGTIVNGQTVALQSDGTVTAIAASGGDPSVGSSAVFESAGVNFIASAFDSNSNKVVIAYQDDGNSSYGTAVVGTVSGTSITFGSPVIFESANSRDIGVCFDSSNNKIVISYMDIGNNFYGTAIVGTVSGTSISFGSAVVFNSGMITYGCQCVFDSNSNKVVIAYQDDDDGDQGTAIVGTVSGTSISFGSETHFETGQLFADYPLSITFDSNSNKVVIAYFLTSGGKAVVGTVSGTSISFGSAVSFNSGSYTSSLAQQAITFDSNSNKVVIAFRDQGNSYNGTAVVGTVSGTSISFGSDVVFNTGSSKNFSAAFDSSVNKVIIAYEDDDNNDYGEVVVGTVSGTSISFTSPINFNAADTNYTSTVFDSNANKIVISYKNAGNSGYGTGVVFTTSGSNVSSFLGIADAAISNAASGKITMKGGIAANGLSGLTPNAIYYVQDDGTLNTATSAVNYDIANGSYTQAFSVASQETYPSGIAFNADGTKMFISGKTGDDINEYTLSTAYDVSTASFVDSFDVSAQQAAVMGVAFNTDGTKMFIVGETEDTVAQYALSTGFDVSSASFTQTFSIASQETEAQSVTFNTDGTKMFIVGDTGNDINEYTLSTGFDVSTASFVDSFSLASQTTQPKEGVFNTDGTELYVLARDNQKVYKYTLSTGFDVSTASYASVEFSVSSQETSPQGLAFSADGSKMYVCGDTGDDVNQYATTSTATNSTTVEAGKALSSTSINLDYST